MAAGLMPIDFENKSSQSALSVYPLAIANCQETRLCGHHYMIIHIYSSSFNKLAVEPVLCMY